MATPSPHEPRTNAPEPTQTPAMPLEVKPPQAPMPLDLLSVAQRPASTVTNLPTAPGGELSSPSKILDILNAGEHPSTAAFNDMGNCLMDAAYSFDQLAQRSQGVLAWKWKPRQLESAPSSFLDAWRGALPAVASF